MIQLASQTLEGALERKSLQAVDEDLLLGIDKRTREMLDYVDIY